MVVRGRGLEIRVSELIGWTVHAEDLPDVGFAVGWPLALDHEAVHIFKGVHPLKHDQTPARLNNDS